jgi:hypothetical protein
MTLSAKYATILCLLVLTCLPVFYSSDTETPTSAIGAIGGDPLTSPDLQSEPAPTAQSGIVATNLDDVRVASSSSLEPDTNHATTISPHEKLQELAWLLTNGDPGSQRRADDLVEEIYRQGYTSLLAIHDFLIRDIGFGSEEIPGTDAQALRQVLIDLLLRFDFPEVEQIALELLKSHPTPMEIWQLGRYLEANHPGEYSNSVRIAAEDALLHANPATEIPGGFFQLLGETGNDETALLMADLPIHQEVYANFALAAIPDGSGISMLEQEALQLEKGPPSTRSRLLIELLASQAHRSIEAGEVLIDMAERGLIPADTWPHVMAIVAGSLLITLEPPLQGQLETHTIFRSEGNQVIYRVARPIVDESPGIADQRHYLLDRLQALAPGYRGVFK